jgi:hypothetical protein
MAVKLKDILHIVYSFRNEPCKNAGMILAFVFLSCVNAVGLITEYEFVRS